MNEAQVQKTHYNFESYVDLRRWGSYYHQIEEVVKCDPKKVLIIGAGDKIVPCVLRLIYNSYENGGARTQIEIFDFDSQLEPNYIGDVREIIDLVEDKKFDCIVCCQVLEHIEFKFFDSVLEQFREILEINGTLILSLPQGGCRYLWADVNFPLVHLKKVWVLPKMFLKPYVFNGEHYWEIGYKGTSRKIIVSVIKKYFCIQKSYTVFENPYHWLVIGKRK